MYSTVKGELMFRQACLRSLMASSVFVSVAFVGVSSGHAGFLVDADKAAEQAESQPLGVKKRISGWTSAPVEAVTSANAGGKLVPCILSTKYEEGTSIRFSGGGQSLLGISIVKGFDIFKPAYRYPVTVTYAGQMTQRFQATSLDQKTLVVPLGEPDKAYQNLVKASKHFAPYVTVGIADFEQNYALDEIASGLANLESCYGRKPIEAPEEAVQEVSRQPALDLTDDEIEELEAYAAISQEQKEVLSEVSEETVEAAEMAEAVEAQELEPIKLEADLSEEPVEEDVVALAQDAEDDVAQRAEDKGLYVTNVAEPTPPQPSAPAMRSVVVTPDEDVAPKQVAAVKPVMTPMPEKVDLGLLHSIWVSSKGETVEMVLRRWSGKAGLDFEWNRKEAVQITEDKIYRGSYEDVTQKILADYDLLSAVEGDLEEMKKRDVSFAMVEENVLPEDTISRTESVETAEARKKEKAQEPSAVGGFFDGLAGIFSSKDEPKAEEVVATAPTPKFEVQKRDPWVGRKFPENGASPSMAAVPAAPVQAVSIVPAEPEQPIATAVPVSTMPAAPRIEAQQASAPMQIEFDPQRWRALKGANLQEVLQVWAEDAGVRLNWKSYRHYAVQDSISLKVPFDQAIVHTLDQFDVHSVRPMGHLFVRPDGSEAVLTIYDSE